MKKLTTILYVSIALLVSVVSCKSDDMNYKDATVTAVNTLYEPIDNRTIKILSSNTASVYFEWERVRVEDSGAALYEVVFDKKGNNFENPLYTMVSDNNGYSNGATVTHRILNRIASMAGVAPGETGELIWTVVASRGINTAVSAVVRHVSITTLDGFVDIPEELFLTGEGSEAGNVLTGAMPFKSVAPGEYEIFAQLTTGSTYQFVDRNQGTPRAFYSDGNLKLIESNTDESSTAAKNGVFRIQVDFNTATVAMTEIKTLGLWFSPDNKVLWNLNYEGKGIWSGSGVVNFKQEGWGRDERYKFQLTVNDGQDRTVQLGTLNGTDSKPTSQSPPSYYFVKWIESPTQWDDKWKFVDAVDGKSPTIKVVLQGDKEYTHSVTVN
ncbi:SusE domain-containing protein [Sphingobacterium sp. DN00404]|uniref:SusE domain-containing protein n=1 Tax=Sphingobacterium micropteri TaxID=2763501 RepID=A0ABR7YTU7_9SPHI|nr:SusE domain-containing protein [Sphingobacterium micropteri]MBD1434755.1 SusE domain-containing protein [Sphingobacterium micropteri]